MYTKTFIVSLLAALAAAEPLSRAQQSGRPTEFAEGDGAAAPTGARPERPSGVAAESGHHRHGHGRHGRHGHGSARPTGSHGSLDSAFSGPATTFFTATSAATSAVVVPTSAPAADDGEGDDDDSGSDNSGADDSGSDDSSSDASDSSASSADDEDSTTDLSATPTLPSADQPTDDASADDTELKRRAESTAPASTSLRRRRNRTRTRTRTATATGSAVTQVITDIFTATTIVTGGSPATDVPASADAISSTRTVTSASSSSSSSSSTARTTAKTSAAAVTSSAPSSSSTGTTAKKGLSYNDITLLPAWSGKANWVYNWSPSPDGTLPSGMSFLPMKWCPESSISDSNVASFASAVSSAGASRVLSFNEPDLSGQCNIDVSTAVAGHKKYFAPLAAKGIKVGSPAVTNGGGTMGLGYLSSFLSACGPSADCPVDFLAIHWYGDSASDFKDHVTKAVTLATANGIKETFVTEFALNGDDNAKQAAFVDEVVPWLDSQAGVAGYAYFMATEGRFSSGTGISAQLGTAYASA